MNKISDKQGVLGSLNKDILLVDHTYQREPNARLVEAISEKWKWSVAGCITVSKRGNDYYVIDGQHRVLAAKNIPEITHLPCIIYDNMAVEQEAATFYEVDSMKKSLSAVEKFKALVRAGDETAVYVNNRVESYNFRVASSGSNTVNCINYMTKAAKMSKTRFERVLSVCAQLCKYSQIPAAIFKGLNLLDQKFELSDKKLIARILEIGKTELMASIKLSMYKNGSMHEKACALGIVEAVNKGLRQKFEL